MRPYRFFLDVPLEDPNGYHGGRVRGKHDPEAGVRPDLPVVVQALVQRR